MNKLIVFLFIGLASARLSDEKCKEYYEKPLPNKSSLINEFPHMGLLAFAKDDDIYYSCPATLISESFALTPAYCLTTTHSGIPKHIILGTLNPNRKDDNYKSLDIVDYIIHPDYTKGNPTETHSIALVKFSPQITPTEYIRPACLYTKSIDGVQKLVDVLWGKPPIQELFKVNSSVVPITSCIKSYKEKLTIDEQSHLCVNREFGKEFKRNIGGTSHTYEDDVPKIVAIDNFGPTTQTSKFPDVTTVVYHYLDWIEKNVWGA